MASIEIIFDLDTSADSENERPVHIKVLPLLWACLLNSSQAKFLFRLFQLLFCHRMLIWSEHEFCKIFLCEYQNDRYLLDRLINFLLPLWYVVVWDLAVDGDANQEYIGLMVLGLTIGT